MIDDVKKTAEQKMGKSIDALKHDWTVGHDCVEIGGSREALVRPQLLVPAEADDPRVVRMRGGVIANALLQVGN